jgi:hypothetical protein
MVWLPGSARSPSAGLGIYKVVPPGLKVIFSKTIHLIMTRSPIILLLLCWLLLPLGVFGQPANESASKQVLPGDLATLIGEWEGTLTYLDYTTNQPYTMPANLVVRPGRNENQLKASHSYPSEPQANENFTFRISRDGSKFNRDRVSSREVLPDGQIRIITTHRAKDGNERQMALIRFTYTIGPTEFGVRKEVQFVGTTDWIMRNEYRYQKN